MTRTTTPLALLALLTVASTLAVGYGSSAQYVAGATVVAKQSGDAPLLDQGGVVCDSAGPSLGGGCIAFGPYDSIHVGDATAGAAVAFQVCIDNNGDGICGGPQSDGGAAGAVCPDEIFYSHDDAGRFFNPLGPLPTSFLRGCETSTAFPGYVVLLCEGVHGGRGPRDVSAHAHGVTTGTISGATGGTGYGDFCAPHGEGGADTGPGKPYRVV